MGNNAHLPKKTSLYINTDLTVYWVRRGSKIYCELVYQNKVYKGHSVKKHNDIFEQVFGMRKALESVFRNNNIDRKIRKLIYDRFKDTYGLGECNQKETVSDVHYPEIVNNKLPINNGTHCSGINIKSLI